MCKLANLTTRGFSLDLGIIAKGVELGPMTSPNLLTVRPLGVGGLLAVAEGAGSFIGSIRACLVSLPTSIGIIGTNFLGWELIELDLRRPLGDVLSASKVRFVLRCSFSSTGLNSDPDPPGLPRRPQHEQRW